MIIRQSFVRAFVAIFAAFALSPAASAQTLVDPGQLAGDLAKIPTTSRGAEVDWDPLTPEDGQYETDTDLHSVPSVPVSCDPSDDSNECHKQIQEMRARLADARFRLEKLLAIYLESKAMVEEATAFGNSLGSLPGQGLGWYLAWQDIQSGWKQLRKSYKCKVGDFLDELRAILRDIEAFEAANGEIANWYERFGYIYYEAMNTRYDRLPHYEPVCESRKSPSVDSPDEEPPSDLPNRAAKPQQEVRDEKYAERKGWPQERLQDLRRVDERYEDWSEAMDEAFDNPSERNNRALENTAEKYQNELEWYEQKWGKYKEPWERTLDGAMESLGNTKSPPSDLDELSQGDAAERSGESEPGRGDEPDQAGGEAGGDQGEEGTTEDGPSDSSPNDSSEPGSGQERGDEPDQAGGDEPDQAGDGDGGDPG